MYSKLILIGVRKRTFCSFSEITELTTKQAIVEKSERPFVDRTVVKIKAGDGGSGCLSFTREKYRRRGPAWGGDGGRGGDVIIQTSESVHDLYGIRRSYTGVSGISGSGKSKDGANGKDVIIKVPVGTLVQQWNDATKTTSGVIADLDEPNQSFVIAKGGRGGRGNQSFTSSTDRTPLIKEQGKPGQQKHVQLELKIIADVGLVGFPNVGKSSILNAISRATPTVAPYAFTTLRPYIGIVDYPDYSQIRVADLPGLIEGAHENRGLGHEFLRHIERTKILCFVLDMGKEEPHSPYEEFLILQNELKEYNTDLLNRKFLIVGNKMDLPKSQKNYKKFLHDVIDKNYTVIPISAANNDVQKLKDEFYKLKFDTK